MFCLLKILQFFGLFQFSFKFKKTYSIKRENKASFRLKFKKSTILYLWSIFLFCFSFIFGIHNQTKRFLNYFVNNSKYDVFGVAYNIYDFVFCVVNLILYYIFFKNSSKLKSIFKFLIDITNCNDINISKLFFVFCLPPTIILSFSELFFIIKHFQSKDFSVLFILNQTIAYTKPYLSHNSVFSVFIFIALSISKIFDVKVNDFENIFYAKYYTDDGLRYNSKNFERILGKQIYDKNKIIRTLSIFSAKLHILNIYQNKINSFFGLQISHILCESISWIVFIPFSLNYKLNFTSIFINALSFSSPILFFVTCCFVPEVVLTKVSVFRKKLNAKI